MNSLLFRRLVTFIPVIALGAFWVSIEQRPHAYVWAAPVVITVIFLAGFLVIRKSIRSGEFWHFITAPMVVALSGLSFVLFLDSMWQRGLVLIISGIASAWYCRNVVTFLTEPSAYQPYALENISSYLNLLSAFFLYTSFFSVRLFLSWPVWLPAFLAGLITALLSEQMRWVNKLPWSRSIPFTLVLALVMAEAFLTIQFLPTVSLVNGLYLTVLLYTLSSLTRLHLSVGLEPRVVRRYVGTTVAALTVTILTARWI